MARLRTHAAAIWACRTSPKWTNALLVSMLLMICGALGSVMLESRSSQFVQASVEASNISSLISQDVSRNLELFDLSIILLPGTGGAGAIIVAEKLRAAVEGLNISHPAAMHRRFTISIGVASIVPTSDRTAAQLIDEADAALYGAKNSGRNQASWKRPLTALKLVS